MDYWYEKQQRSYADFASGSVLINARGTTSFPVRLASEIAQRCFHLLESAGLRGPYTIYDPCCGGAYMLTVIGLMHGSRIQRIYASDVNPDMIAVAGSNLSLLTPGGMRTRIVQIEEHIRLYHKPSHEEALQSAKRLSSLLSESAIDEIVPFQADFIGQPPHAAVAAKPVHLLMSDVPYGDIASWESASDRPLDRFFDHAWELLRPTQGIAAVIADKGQKLKHDRFERLTYLKIGKRHVGLFKPID
ncbi:MAG: hypothetical protein K0Q59_4019 [Paenibacillus sp.]|jgi:hypothetical protein|nr:hypothetical protein [Paenibacillus sp.]